MRMRLLMPLAIAAVMAGSTPAATPAHDPILSNEQVLVQRLVLEPGAATPMHTHAHDHIAVALAGGEIAVIAPDGTERRLRLAEGALRFVPAGITHAMHNAGDAAFQAVTIDLLGPQTGTRNRCGALVPDQPTDCAGDVAGGAAGATDSEKKRGAMIPQMETDQTLVSLLTLAPGARHEFRPAPLSPLIVTLAGGDALCPPPRTGVTLTNTGSAPARFVVLEFKPTTGGADASREAFVAMARHALCADQRNRLSLIDRVYVFWERVGSCPDNAYGAALYGDSPATPLCSSGDSIAGPVSHCDTQEHRTIFETITGHPDAPDLGLGPGHTVESLPL